jgi:cobalt-zinc-cadmium efflux system membrane fusion protein
VAAIEAGANTLAEIKRTLVAKWNKIDVLLMPTAGNIYTKAEVEADPARLARVTAPLPGRIVQLFVRFGDKVQKGQPLFEIDSPDLVAAQTEYLRAKSAQAQAERTLARQQDLRQAGIGAAREVEQAQTDRDLARSELERAALRLRLLGIDVSTASPPPGATAAASRGEGVAVLGRPLTVRAPLSGRIVEYRVAPGDYRSSRNVSSRGA